MTELVAQERFKPESILVTGGCGFIGSNFIRFVLSLESPPKIINIDKLTYAGNLQNISDCIKSPSHTFIKGDILDSTLISRVFREYAPDAVINFAAESHVDRSITNPHNFFETNVGGTLLLLEYARSFGVKRFLQISTDEVYGSLGATGSFTAKSQLAPNSPYAASKASADHFARAYYRTYNLDTVITRCSNNYGPYQFPEKLVPLAINNAYQDKSLPIYGDGLNIRDWIHVKDHCIGIWIALTKGRAGAVYNFGGNCELSNVELVKKILHNMDKPESLINFVENRLGHDYRYAVDITHVRKELGWAPSISFDIGLKETIEWYIQNREWLESVTSGDYKKYYQRHYGAN